MSLKLLFGFHAVSVRLKVAPKTIRELHIDATRRDQRMRQFVAKAEEAGLPIVESDDDRLQKMCGTHRHQGIVAKVEHIPQAKSLDDLLDAIAEPPLLLVLDGITDPHNLGACLRVADGAGAHAETVPYFMVTNLSRTLGELKERDIWIVGTSDDAPRDLYAANLAQPTALVLGAEGSGMRQLTRKNCDELVSIPMMGGVESLNVSVASGVCLYEARRQRGL